MTRLFHWLKQKRLLGAAVLVSLLIAAVSFWIFIEVADEVHEGESQYFDEWLLRALRTNHDLAEPIGPAWLPQVARDLTALGSGAVITFIVLIVAGSLALQRKWGTLCLIIVSVSGGALMSETLKTIYSRARPHLVPHLTEVSSLSFPSGHSMISAVMYLTLGALLARTTVDRSMKIYFLGSAVILTFIVGITRIYLGVHFPSDVLAGWCAGIAWALLCSVIARWLQQRGAVEQETK